MYAYIKRYEYNTHQLLLTGSQNVHTRKTPTSGCCTICDLVKRPAFPFNVYEKGIVFNTTHDVKQSQEDKKMHS